MRITVLLFIIIHASSKAQLPVILHETFDDNRYGWFEGETSDHRVVLQKGKYLIDAPEGGWMSYLAPYVEKNKDFSIEATFTQIDGKENNGLGFIWGFDGQDGMNNFTFTSSGYFRIYSSDRDLGVSDEWRSTNLIKPIGKENKLKVERKKNLMFFYLNGKQVASAKAFPWDGKYMGFVTYTKMKLTIDDFIFAHDIRINLPLKMGAPGAKENLGKNVNSRFDEVSPKISSDGKIIYFGRKHSPENTGGPQDKEDIWESRTPDGKIWSKGKNLGAPVNTPTTNNLISVNLLRRILCRLFSTTSY